MDLSSKQCQLRDRLQKARSPLLSPSGDLSDEALGLLHLFSGLELIVTPSRHLSTIEATQHAQIEG